MTFWLPSMLAFVLVAVEVRRLLLGHWRREWWRSLLARATVLTVGAPAIFEWNVGMDVDYFLNVTRVVTPWLKLTEQRQIKRATRTIVVKIDYSRGKLWVADV